MKKYILLLIAFMALCLAQPTITHAQTNVEVNTQNLNELIETLENETARNDFIQNLKTLKDSAENKEQAGIEEGALTLSDRLGLGEQTEEMLGGYNAFLQENNLKSSFIGQIGLTLGAIIVAFIVFLMVRKLGLKLRDYLLKIKKKYAISHNRYRVYARSIRYSGYILVGILFLFSMASIWNISDLGFMQSNSALAFMGDFLNIVVVSIIAISIWEIVNIAAEYAMKKSIGADSSRTHTLLPMVKNVLFVAFALLFTLVVLSEIGINVLPLLAGAGVLGIAIGFGAQTMVKDLLAGFTIILEDLVQIGDVITIAGRTGLVEHITIRKIQLRGLDGTVYTVPFSEIDVIENLTKEFSYYLMEVGIAYRENPDEVIRYLNEISDEMRGEKDWKNAMLDDIEILGVDQFADSAIIIKARLKTAPARQWGVGREYNRRLKHKFDDNNVEMPFPHQTIYFGEDKNGNAPPAPIRIEAEEKIAQDNNTKNTEPEKDTQKDAA